MGGISKMGLGHFRLVIKLALAFLFLKSTAIPIVLNQAQGQWGKRRGRKDRDVLNYCHSS